MRRGVAAFFLVIAAVLSGTGAFAQHTHPIDPSMGGYQNQLQNLPQAGSQDMNQTDSVATEKEKPKKPKKPLESYFFNDSVRGQANFKWTIDLESNNVNVGSVDTVLNIFQVDYPYLKRDVGSAYLGNLGGAAIPLNYFTRANYRDFEFAEAYDVYFFTPERAPFYNVKRPFTQLSYYTAGQKKRAEESLYVSHAQNVSPSTGFNVDYKSRGTKGIYSWQKARDKNLSLAISHTGKKYTVHGGYIFNRADLRENGGIEDDKWILDTIMELPENIPINLKDATNLMNNNTFYAVQSYGIPLRKLTDADFSISDQSTIYFGMSTEYSRFNKTYKDTKANSGEYYENWYINSVSTHDSIAESRFSNKLFIQLQPWGRDAFIGLIDGGVGMDLHRYYHFRMEDYLQGKDSGTKRESYYVYGQAHGKMMRYADWGADFKLHPAGSRSGDLEIGANVALHAYSKGRPMTLSGSLRSTLLSPGYWEENYFSNHFVWSNSFKKEKETRFDVTFSVPHLALQLGGYQSLLTDRIFYDSESLPAQAGSSVSVTGLYASKDFRIGGLHLDNRVLLQWSSDQQVVPVPMASAFLTYYYDFTVVKNVLHMQLGFDGRYNTRYYAFAYNPAIAQFYNQREKELGDYIMMDAFAAAKWKRMRILLKFQHVNEGLWGTRNYFTVLHYPLNKRILKLGISWGFYD